MVRLRVVFPQPWGPVICPTKWLQRIWELSDSIQSASPRKGREPGRVNRVQKGFVRVGAILEICGMGDHSVFRFQVDGMDGSQSEKFVLGHVLAVGHEKSNSDTPADFQNLPFVGVGAGGQDGTDSLSLLEDLFADGESVSTFEKMNSDILFPFSLGDPNHGGLDDVGKFFIVQVDGVFAAQDIARRKRVPSFMKSD